MFDISIPFFYLSATLKQCFTEFPVSGNVFHHVYMSVRGRIPTCDLIGWLFLGSGLQITRIIQRPLSAVATVEVIDSEWIIKTGLFGLDCKECFDFQKFENCFVSAMTPYVDCRVTCNGRSLSIYGSECQIWKTFTTMNSVRRNTAKDLS